MKFTRAKIALIDTNILVYAYDRSVKEKFIKANEIVKDVWESRGAITLQNLCEFFAVVTQKVEMPLKIELAAQIVTDIFSSREWIVIDRSANTVIKAMNLCAQFKVHFWDALIAATMQENRVDTIITENDKDFKRIKGLTVINPFS